MHFWKKKYLYAFRFIFKDKISYRIIFLHPLTTRSAIVLIAIGRTPLAISHASFTTYGGRSSPELYRGWLELLMMPMVFMGNPLPPTPTLLITWPAGHIRPGGIIYLHLFRSSVSHRMSCSTWRTSSSSGDIRMCSITHCNVRFSVCVSDFLYWVFYLLKVKVTLETWAFVVVPVEFFIFADVMNFRSMSGVMFQAINANDSVISAFSIGSFFPISSKLFP